MRQIGFKFKTWGGRRRGAGRKPKGEKAGVSHATRPILKRRFPVHVTVRMREEVWNLRSGRCFRALRKTFFAANTRAGFQVVHFSIQGNHIHFLVEAEGKEELTRGMRGLTVRMASALNRVMNRQGRVFDDRYHAEIITNLQQARNSLRYVLRNYEHHLKTKLPPQWCDPYATARAPVAAPKTWLLAHAPPGAAAAAPGKHAQPQ